jgi:hypothetical protein
MDATVEESDETIRADREGGPEDEDSDDGEAENDTTHAKDRGRREDSVGYEEPEEEEQAANDKLDEADLVSDDETYGGSPKPSRATTPDPESDDEDEDEEMLIPTDEASDIRRDRIMNSSINNHYIADFVFDDRKGAFCEITLEFSSSTPKLLMLHHVETAADFATIHVIPGITAAQFSAKQKKDEEDMILTEGSNLTAIREYGHIINVNRILTNDIVAMLHLYGVEAARATIVREMDGVFSGHGISVDLRHLNLIADTMTKGGGFTPFNRIGMRGNVSPFMKMSFETTVGFLKDAVLERDWDELKNPSARIVVGRLGGIGTGAFDVLAPVKIHDPLKQGLEEVQDVVTNGAREKRDSDSESESEEEEVDEDGDVEMEG